MKGFNRIYKADPVFWNVLISVLLLSGACLAFYAAKDLFFRLNTIHTLYLDTFFQNYTLLGDGVFSIAVFLILLLAERTTLAMQVITGYLLSGILAQVLKRTIHAPRPHAIITFCRISSFHRFRLYQFPLWPYCLGALNTNDKRLSLIYLITAIITGYSRIYLGQHFLADVAAGALIGVLSAMLVYWYLRQVKIEWIGVNKEGNMQLQ